MKDCGPCSLCCKLLRVPIMDAPEGHWCKHASQCGEGCAIHAERPNFCKTFNCLWKQSPVLGPELRPDTCGIVFEAFFTDRIVIAMCDSADLWKAPAPAMLIQQMLSDGFAVWAIVGKERNLLLPVGDSIESAVDRSKSAFTRVM